MENVKESALKTLKNADGYVSGQEMGEKLGVSRSAVWKAITALKEIGYEIESVTNKGYRLLPSDVLNEYELAQTETEFIGGKIYFKYEVVSTNDEIKALARLGESEGAVFSAEVQTGGKGRLGRKWISPPKTGIWFSLLLRPNLAPISAPMITLIAGVAVCETIREITGLDAKIKWPNDIIINDKKVCGILTEMSAEMERINYIALGIGINVGAKSFDGEIKSIATSLSIESGKDYNRARIMKNFFKRFEAYYKKYVIEESFSGFAEKYKALCDTVGKEVNVIARDGFSGRAIDITPDGELIVEKENGERVVVYSGEVSVRKKES